MIIKGIDRGTTYTKDEQRHILKSTVREFKDDEIVLDSSQKIIVEFENKKYIVGEIGNSEVDLMKSTHKHTKLLILTILGLYSKNHLLDCKLVTGLPIGLYSKQKEEMKYLFHNKEFKININNNQKIIRIHQAETFPECASSFYTTSYNDALLIDVGGLSIDVALFEDRKLIKYSTYPSGVMKLYSKMANQINHKHDTSLSEWDMERVITKGLYINGKKINLNIDKEHFDEIMRRISLDYDLKTQQNILLTGGGSNLFKKFYDYQILGDCQFSNALGYRNIGRMVFGE